MISQSIFNCDYFSVSLRILSSFYSTDYDWGVVHRKIGESDDNEDHGSRFQTSDFNLAAHIRDEIQFIAGSLILSPILLITSMFYRATILDGQSLQLT